MREVNLTKGYVALVDDEDFEFLSKFNWYAQKMKGKYYAYRSAHKNEGERGTKIVMHRIIAKTPRGMECDHSDHNTLNNQKYNLRNYTKKNNVQNKSSSGVSKFLGVSIQSVKSKDKVYTYWRAAITKGGNHSKQLGTFPFTKEGEIRAAMAYDIEAMKLFGEFANLNFCHKSPFPSTEITKGENIYLHDIKNQQIFKYHKPSDTLIDITDYGKTNE